ncbi:MAG: hypothetical protein HKN82_00190 [Akkermansiaceae bacterium]|nr:hypothetical protein [Akkermansiaceae bacterium]
MKRWSIVLIATAFAFGLGWQVASYMFKTLGPHGWANAYMALHQMQRELLRYKETYGALPSKDRIDGFVAQAWEGDTSFYDLDSTAEEQYLHYVAMLADNDRLRLWDSPPQFTVTTDSPVGFGFFLEGQDGISNTNGQDPDDINSWSIKSTSYYYRPIARRRATRDGILAALIALPVFLFAVAKTAPTRTNNDAQQVDAGNPV